MSCALVFPGQGSQSLKMMDSYLEQQIVLDTFKQANQILGDDYLAMLQEDSADLINQTVNTQPLLLTASYALYRLWVSKKGQIPSILAGHSLGEWTALVASGVVDFSDALKLVKLRATAMQECLPSGAGAMAAVLGLEDKVVVDTCSEVANTSKEVVAAVNFNSPGQVVIAGSKNAVELASLQLKEKGARKIQLLSVSVPSHCILMKPASERLAIALQEIEFKSPQIPVLHNYSVVNYTEPNAIKDALVKQLYLPVRWTETIQAIATLGVTKIIECGPGKVLTGLNKRINDQLVSFNLSTLAGLESTLVELN